MCMHHLHWSMLMMMRVVSSMTPEVKLLAVLKV